MFHHAIVRQPCRRLAEGLTAAGLGRPDVTRARSQHDSYVRALEACGLTVHVQPADDRFPDGCFIEDTGLCTPRGSVVMRPGAQARRGEIEGLAALFSGFFETVERIEAPGTVDGGDVMMVGDHYFIGVSERTNEAGAEQLIGILETFGLAGSTISFDGMLHLKTGLAYLENNRLLALPDFAGLPQFAGFDAIEVAAGEDYAANSIWVNGRVVMPAGYPTTRQRVAALGYEVIEVDTSEFRKLDGGVSCLSLRF